jgi:3-keto-5-aminohexanoate cleavage enzyme
MSQPIMIAVAPNGARKQKSDHPALPITASELADTALSCKDAGACMIHLHVRDKQGKHLLDIEAYRVATQAIRSAVGSELIIQVTTEAVGVYSIDQQIAVIKGLKPEAVSIAVREFCGCADQLEKAAHFFAWLHKERICPQYIIYSVEDAIAFRRLRKSGIILGDSVAVLFVLGKTPATSNEMNLMAMIEAAGSPIVWSVCAFGAEEGNRMFEAAKLGGHARVGFENNTQLINGDVARDNADLVAQLVSGVESIGRDVASGATARVLWGMI